MHRLRALAFLANGDHANAYIAERQAFRLQPLITNIGDWILTSAKNINDAGQIVGTGTRGSQTRGFLLTPTSGRYVPPSGGR